MSLPLALVVGLAAAQPTVTAAAVLEAVDARVPELAAARLRIAEKEAELLKTQGAFDPVLSGKLDRKDQDPYRWTTGDVALTAPLAVGPELQLGHRLGVGKLPVYAGEDATAERGELRLQATVPLLQDLGMTEARAQALVKEAAVVEARAKARDAEVKVTAKAALSWAKWVAAAEKLALAERLAELAERRQAALERQVAEGAKARIDATVTETNIHEPDDAAQLWDVVRVLTRSFTQAVEAGLPVVFNRRTLRAKRRRMEVLHAKRKKARRAAYRDLLKVTEEVLDMAEAAVAALQGHASLEALACIEQLQHYAALGRQVVDQTRRRVIHGETVPAKDKVVSIFEPHTDIIVKGRRKVQFGHKMFVSAGASSIVFDLFIAKGNRADSTLADEMVDRTAQVTGRVPRQVSMDGGFASKANLEQLKARGVKDVCFSKGRGLSITEMVKSAWVYKRLRRFRAGVEGIISFLKRAFGLDRCTWRGEDGFARYAWASVVACNLLVIARHTVT